MINVLNTNAALCFIKQQGILLLLLVLPGTVLSNAGIFDGFGQSIHLKQTAKIQMVSEEIDIYLLRAGGRVTGSLNHVDRARYVCRFELRNLTDEVVTVPVGFPLVRDNLLVRHNDDSVNQTAIIAKYRFVAGTPAGSYPITYVSYDREKKYRQIFTWSMTFEPQETIQLLVTYEMNGYSGLGDSTRRTGDYRNQSFPDYLTSLTFGVQSAFGYVTTTGNSWAGKIEDAVFRIHLGEFEDYLQRRGAFESLPTDPYYEKRLEHPAFSTLVRDIHPKGWLKEENKRAGSVISWTFTDFEPEHEIRISYLFCGIPSNLQEYENYMRLIREKAEKHMKVCQKRFIEEVKRALSPEAEKDIGDVILQFYGNETGNTNILPFLKAQTWYPAIDPPEMDQALKDCLLKISQQ